MNKLAGKTAIVTGASKGIGTDIARGLAEAGASVAVNYSSDAAGAKAVVDSIVRGGGRAVAIQANVSKQADVERLFKEASSELGALDILVNNAGVFSFGAIEEVTEEEFHRQYNTNVLGLILSVREALKYFGPNGGSIVNTSSVVSTNPIPMSAIYSSTKAAVDNLTRGLALELGGRKIRVNGIAPGPTATEGAATLGVLEGESGAKMAAASPFGRVGQPQDITPAVVFLASEDSSWISGETIRVSGGMV